MIPGVAADEEDEEEEGVAEAPDGLGEDAALVVRVHPLVVEDAERRPGAGMGDCRGKTGRAVWNPNRVLGGGRLKSGNKTTPRTLKPIIRMRQGEHGARCR